MTGKEMQRLIFHIDMDAFFASVEERDNPSLRGKPLIICGDPESRSVVSTASYEARKYGIESGMPVGKAKRLCPHAVYLEGSPGKYIHCSIQILQIYKRFTPIVEPFSIDEAFLDMTGTKWKWSSVEEAAGRIKSTISSEFDMTASVGVAENKLIAKMASSMDKPDGLTVIEPGKFADHFHDLPLNKMWGVGEKTTQALHKIGLRTIGDVADCPRKTLVNLFGVAGEHLYLKANGIDNSKVIPYFEGIEVKSVGHEYTLPCDTDDRDYLERTLLRLSDQVARRLRKKSLQARLICIKIRYSNFRTHTKQTKLEGYTDDPDTIFEISKSLLSQFDLRRAKIRLIGVSAGNLVHTKESYQPGLFYNSGFGERADLTRVLDDLRNRYGENVISRARLLG
jgi:DNA polymerase-4